MFWLPTFSCWLKQIFWKAFHRLVLFVQVNKETSMDNLLPSHHGSVVRPKERRPDVHQQIPFMRGNTIIRSKTFSPGPQSQYICRVTHTHKRYETSDSKRSDEYSVRYVNWCLTLCCFFFGLSDKPQWQRQLHALQEVSVCQKRLWETQHAHEEGKTSLLSLDPSLRVS